MSSKNCIKKLGIIAGSGQLPKNLIDYCKSSKIDSYVLAFEGQTESENIKDANTIFWSQLGTLKKNLDYFHQNSVKDLVLCGGIKRPHYSDIKLDWLAIRHISKALFSNFGDDALLKSIKNILEKQGFNIYGYQRFLDKDLFPAGILTNIKPTEQQITSVQKGAEILDRLSGYDIGQAVVVEGSKVIGIEGPEGTDKLIERCAPYCKEGILIKAPKQGQDKDLDLPAMGLDTIKTLAKFGYVGLAGKSNESFFIDQKEAIRLSNDKKIWVYGF